MAHLHLHSCAILNAGPAAWTFEDQARRLARFLEVEVRSSPAQFNYLLAYDDERPLEAKSFIPYEAILVASDKRRMAEAFERDEVATPRTYMLDTPDAVAQVLEREAGTRWVLKWPIGCGATGHRLLQSSRDIPEDWPRPFVVQQFIELEQPEVFRLYGITGETFGWNARRFPAGVKASPFVAHAQGARYEDAGTVPPEAERQARAALAATGLLASFGCADLMRDKEGRWLVLEVNTDGIFQHVDRDIGVPGIADEIDQRLGEAFWAWVHAVSADVALNQHNI